MTTKTKIETEKIGCIAQETVTEAVASLAKGDILRAHFVTDRSEQSSLQPKSQDIRCIGPDEFRAEVPFSNPATLTFEEVVDETFQLDHLKSLETIRTVGTGQEEL